MGLGDDGLGDGGGGGGVFLARFLAPCFGMYVNLTPEQIFQFPSESFFLLPTQTIRLRYFILTIFFYHHHRNRSMFSILIRSIH